ncbi:ornithine cyclodeaminase family protein [Brevibacterium jeotgali]|uniref:Ornithine cyclodeaminase n=1 Tax=Brevibacterium jeotgali TaxID=1262550 RepID=A0A2H1L3Z6_9MICO|nr:ornithine cyclodeaminase family protein [Brevibacterium jeotgali]TWB98772.1 ornithine cyclodeaminase [Brevibacterium jeotgali]SMY11628.1 ornithine cyclodeaminase [Brevibacterium jeotgali]
MTPDSSQTQGGHQPTGTDPEAAVAAPLMLGPAEVAAVGFADAIAALRDAVVDFDPESDRIRTRVPMENGDYVLMPSEVGAHTGIKVLTLTPGNPDRGLPFIQGAVLLSDSTTHTLQAVLDGAALTNLRTPALSFAAVSETIRARFPDGIRLVIVGTGVQGSLHLDAARSVARVTHVTYGVRTVGRSDTLRDVAAQQGITAAEALIGPALDAAVRDADVVVTATSSDAPVLSADAVPDHAVVIGMGAHEAHQRELPGALLERSQVIVESRASAEAESGDVGIAIREGALSWDAVLTLRDVVTAAAADPAPGRPIVNVTTGMSWEDVVVSAAVWRGRRND